jgi:hypothetical protein
MRSADAGDVRWLSVFGNICGWASRNRASPTRRRCGRVARRRGGRSDGSGLSAWECLRRLRCRFGPSRPAMELSRCRRLVEGAAMTGQRRVRLGLRHIRALKLGGTIWGHCCSRLRRASPAERCSPHFVCDRTWKGATLIRYGAARTADSARDDGLRVAAPSTRRRHARLRSERCAICLEDAETDA